MAHHLKTFLLIILCLASFYTRSAENLRDPTRGASVPQSSSSSTEVIEKPQVQIETVVTSKDGTSKGVVALQNGEIIRVGDNLNGGKIVSIEPQAVVIRTVEGKLEKIALYPAVNIEPVQPPTKKPRAKAKQNSTTKRGAHTR